MGAMDGAGPANDFKLADHPDWVAYHEAGHAVAHAVLRTGFTRATIVADPMAGTLGHVLRKPWPAGLARRVNEGEMTPGMQDPIEAEIMTLYAGDVALRLYLGDAAPRVYVGQENPFGEPLGSDADLHHAMRYGSHVSCEAEELEAYLTWLRLRTVGLLKYLPHWRAVQAVAAALLDRQTLSGRQVRQIVRSALNEGFPPLSFR